MKGTVSWRNSGNLKTLGGLECGKAIGIDMTDEMLDKARNNAVKAGYTNVEFKKGDIENGPTY